MLKYLKEKNHKKLMLRVKSLLVVNWWIDTSCNTNDDCRVCTGCMMILVKGVVLS